MRDRDEPRSRDAAFVATTIVLGAASGALVGALEALAWLVHEVVLKSFYVQDRLGPTAVLRELVDVGVVWRAALLYAGLGLLGGMLAALPTVAIARRDPARARGDERARATVALALLATTQSASPVPSRPLAVQS